MLSSKTRRVFEKLIVLIALSCAADSTRALEMPGPLPNRKIDETKVSLFVSVGGNDASNGKTRKTAFATLQKAADLVQPGQTVLVTKGEYRQGLHIRKEGRANAWINFVAEPGAVIRGSDVRKDWVREAGDTPIYSVVKPPLDDAWHDPNTVLQNRLEQVFVNGQLLRQVPERAMLKPKGVFYVSDADNKMYVCLEGGANPNEQKTEVSMRTWAIAIGAPPNRNTWRDEQVGLQNKASYVRLDGFTVRHVGNFSRMAALQVMGLCHDIIIENCDVQWANYTGIALSSMSIYDEASRKWIDHLGTHITVRHCIASNNGVQGIGGAGVSDLLIENNIIDNNNYKGMSPWFEGGGVKTGFGGARITIRGNVVRNNDNEGLWLDYGSSDSLIENNFVLNALATGILNEVTPAPPAVRANGQETRPELPSEQLQKLKLTLKGTTIRNNVIVGTRAPTGNGISISNSVAADVYNNVLYGNTGGGVQFGGSPTRPDTLGLWSNKAHSNLFDANFRHAETSKDQEDLKGRYFENSFRSNLFMTTRGPAPLRISGEDATPEAWRALNAGTPDVYTAKGIFRDPEHFDFTLADPAMARRIGFDPKAIRLDWRAFYIKPAEQKRASQERIYTPIDLSKVFNRGLEDEVAGDGKGGWGDQGRNDMSRFPTGKQTLDNVPYLLGSKARGALLLDNPFVKPGGFPARVDVPIGGKSFDEINFLYSSAWTTTEGIVDGKSVRLDVPEAARFIVHYADGTQADAPIIVGRHLRDWWEDPSWQEMGALNDNNTYLGWQGPNRSVGRVAAYYFRWTNPEPEKKIVSVSISNEQANAKSAFFVLGMTGANKKAGQTNPRIMHLSFDGDVDAQGANGTEIEAQGFTKMAFAAGKFLDGVQGKSYLPNEPIYYRVPNDWPLQGRGTISLWLKAEDWTTPERTAFNKEKDYTRTMTPFSIGSGASKYSPWGITFEVDKKNLRDVQLRYQLGGYEEKLDATPWLKPNQWFNLAITWQPIEGKPQFSLCRSYLNGKLLSERQFDKPNAVGTKIYIGVPDNGGQPWRGEMDELSVYNQALSPEQIAASVKEVTSAIRLSAQK